MSSPTSPTFLDPETLARPPGYTHVVATTGGTTIYVSGQVALDASGALVGRADFRAQTEQVFRNLEHALVAAGGDLSNVVKFTTFVREMSGLPAFREVRDRFLPPDAPRPASSLVQVVALAGPEFLVEIEAVAWLPN